ncbi:hypothetical protein GUJ93_ZPchr0013g34670 [Zizania palustris]|uniref:Reverse transcriptase zinc-binding domain-containing protein n=1 Tax=Zizania palustris TaxID=103762 RepID=A0A8J5WS86_ZIZPA|nr:hypothetical protein GUJ93_ZPchr0013g34670 [Zizania palustris]
MEIWNCGISLKVKIFIWLMVKRRIQVGDQLRKINWKGDPTCKLCGLIETVDHLFFQCHVAKLLWVFVAETLGWKVAIHSGKNFFELLLNFKDSKRSAFGLQILGGSWVI